MILIDVAKTIGMIYFVIGSFLTLFLKIADSLLDRRKCLGCKEVLQFIFLWGYIVPAAIILAKKDIKERKAKNGSI